MVATTSSRAPFFVRQQEFASSSISSRQRRGHFVPSKKKGDARPILLGQIGLGGTVPNYGLEKWNF